MNKKLSLSLIVCVAIAGRVALSEEMLELPDFFVAPITTEVHRAAVSGDASAYCVVNCSGALGDGGLDPGRLDEEQFTKELRETGSADASRLRLVLRYELSPTGEVGESVRKTINVRLEGLVRASGFEDVYATELFTTPAWSDSYRSAGH